MSLLFAQRGEALPWIAALLGTHPCSKVLFGLARGKGITKRKYLGNTFFGVQPKRSAFFCNTANRTRVSMLLREARAKQADDNTRKNLRSCFRGDILQARTVQE